ncbi:Esterase FE4 [Habropoda laboriosa]|uniref:Carboxylic ester hydrolase n=1 Tax=Habropoda laboriosa TaxID=597456 RepID=A0A0L7QPE4_9HYME|nr:PREDICTED: esterase FE4-like [Habropoda laboriosa]KOC60513.1 Esterase FE4 [Habropoda laboriosa]
MWLSKLVLFGLVVTCTRADQDVQLEISQGILKGLKTETILHNKPYYSFKGIPYAKPNVGHNKFRSPEPADPWEGVYDATKHRSPCPFFCMIKKGLIGDEDCLYLNVYTPVLDKEARKAVMVWFHPGGFNSGMGDDVIFGSDFLIEHDVVVVTFNFRLGAIGFLNTGDKNAPGNAGMKDQVMALKWVKDNIHFFGGCPNRVTIFGDSSGGASVQYHMVSPMSEGLFSGVIEESGSLLNPWSVSYNAREQAFMLGEALGIHTTDSGELVHKLSEFAASDIIAATNEISKNQDGLYGHLFTFVPTIEVDFGQDMFLPTDPWTLIKTGNIADVPVMAGIVASEGLLFAHQMLDAVELLNTEPEKFLPGDLNVTDAGAKKEVGESLKKFYFGDKQVSKENLNEYAAMMSDTFVNAGTMLSIDIIRSKISSPVYQYLFSYEAPFGFMKSLFGISDGVAHGDELTYLFYSNAMKNLPEPGSSAEKMTNTLIKLWTNFARDRNPTSKMDEDITTNWEPMGNENYYLNINKELKLEKDLLKDNHDYWKNMYKDVML